MRFFYSAALYALVPLLLLRLLWRSRRAPGYRQRLAERFGYVHSNVTAAPPVLWVHAVSLGEVQSSAPLVELLLQAYPGHRLLLTTVTPTGAQRARSLFGERVQHAYLPFDLPGAVQRFLQRTRPALLVLVETELWPNLLAMSARRNCRIVLVSARLSVASSRRYSHVAPLARNMLQNIDAIACQTEADAQRFAALGASPGAIKVCGSLKFDAAHTERERGAARDVCAMLGLGERAVWIAASTHAGEEAAALEAHARIREQHPAALLLLAPRHPERFAQVLALCAQYGLQTLCRSSGQPASQSHAVLLLDSTGELPLLFVAASCAFVGGSLVSEGGHNPVEAARWSVPVISGPAVENFEDTYALLEQAGACTLVSDAAQLAQAVGEILADPQAGAAQGAAGATVVLDNSGAAERTLALIRALLPPARA